MSTPNASLQQLESLTPVELDAGTVFSGTPSGRMIRGYAQPTAYTPKVDPLYQFHESMRDPAVWFLNPSDPLYVFGPTGSGKTSLIKQLAARLNFPVFCVNAHGRLEFQDLVGHLSVQQGSMTFGSCDAPRGFVSFGRVRFAGPLNGGRSQLDPGRISALHPGKWGRNH